MRAGIRIRVDGRPARPTATGGRGRRTSLAVRVTAACLLVAVVAVGAAGLVAVRLVAVTARTVTQEVLAQQADVVAAQLAETGGGLRAGAGMRRVVDVLAGQGVTVVVVTARGPRNAGILAPVLEEAEVRRVLDGQPVSAQATSAGVRYLVEARPAPVGGFALVRTTETGPLGGGLVRRNLTVALLAGVAVAVVVGLVVGQLLARPLRRTAIAARLLRSGRRDVRVPVAGPAEVSDVAGAVNELADALARSEERQRRFLLSVSHELRTPLTAVRGFAESLADGVVTGPDAADAGRVIVREADRLDRLVGDLMELARLEADDFRLDPVPVDLAALAADAAAVWETRCADADVRFVLQTGPTRPVRVDPRRLRQVVDGLAENALRVIPAGRVARARDRRRRRGIVAAGPGRWSRPVARGLPGRLRTRSAARPLPGAAPGGHRWRGPRTRARAGDADERDDPGGARPRGWGVLHPHLPRRRYGRYHRSHARRRRPFGVTRNPASVSTSASAEPSEPTPSARSTASVPSQPSCTAPARASAAACNSVRWSVNDSSERPPRSTYSTAAPSTSTTSAPALRPGRCPVSPTESGQGSAAP